MNPNLDIHTFVQTAVVLSVLAGVILLISGLRTLQGARKVRFFRIKRDQVTRGWRRFMLAIVFTLLAYSLFSFAEPVLYSFFPPTLTPTFTPTITTSPTVTTTPTMTLSPTITNTPSETNTATPTGTPFIPLPIMDEFVGVVTPNPNIVFSRLQFSQEIDEFNQPINPSTSFENPVKHLYAVFSFDQMADGVQWTALWLRNGELVYHESIAWDGGSGGWGYTDWAPLNPEMWMSGSYQVQIFVGVEFKVSGEFIVEGDPPTPTLIPTLTLTPTTTKSPTSTITPTSTVTQPPTITPTPSQTRWPTATPLTPTATNTRMPTLTTAP